MLEVIEVTEEMVGRVWQLFDNSLNPVTGPFSSRLTKPENARENLLNVL